MQLYLFVQFLYLCPYQCIVANLFCIVFGFQQPRKYLQTIKVTQDQARHCKENGPATQHGCKFQEGIFGTVNATGKYRWFCLVAEFSGMHCGRHMAARRRQIFTSTSKKLFHRNNTGQSSWQRGVMKLREIEVHTNETTRTKVPKTIQSGVHCPGSK